LARDSLNQSPSQTRKERKGTDESSHSNAHKMHPPRDKKILAQFLSINTLTPDFFSLRALRLWRSAVLSRAFTRVR
jgi:hypothetical protein